MKFTFSRNVFTHDHSGSWLPDRRLTTVTAGLLFTVISWSQSGYYCIDSIITAGVGMGKSNAYYCTVKIKDNLVKYTPYVVNEYGINLGRPHKAFDVLINGQKERYFLKQMVDGNVTLYYLRLSGGIRKYYILRSTSPDLAELNLERDSLQKIIGQVAGDCQLSAQNLKYLKPNKYSLKRYLNDLNSCSGLPFPRFHFGFRFGLTATQFHPVYDYSIYAKPQYKSDLSFTAGAFADVPLFSGNVSFSPEINYVRNHYSPENPGGNFDLIMNYSSINVPLLFKYRFIRKGKIPYIELGPFYSRIIKDRAIVYKYETIGNDTYIETNDSPVIGKNFGGISAGGGFIAAPREKYNWFVEARYNYQLDLSSVQKNFNLSEFSFCTGIIF